MRPDDAAPLEPERDYDKPAGPHLGHGAALRVPVSEGLATTTDLDRETACERLMEAEPAVEASKAMEGGTDQDHRDPGLEALNRPIHAD